MAESYEDCNRKRKSPPCGESKSKSYEGFSLNSNSHTTDEDNSSSFPPREIGEDGHFYECLICDNGGDLLCCDTCPGTYHLQCLNPPLESVPPGDWQCENCCQDADVSIPLRRLKSLEGNDSSNKNLSAGSFQSLHDLADAGDLMENTTKKYICYEEEQNAVNHIGDEKGTKIHAAVNEIKVYTRRMRKKEEEKGEDNNPGKLTRIYGPSELANEDQKDKPAMEASGLFNCSSIQTGSAEEADKVLEINDLNASRTHQPQESNKKPVEEKGRAMELQAKNNNICTQIPNMDQYNKLWILRDVMQESIKGHCLTQNNGGKELQQVLHPKYTESGRYKKEKFAMLRARQKQKVSLRNRSRGLNSGSGIGGNGSLFRLHTEELGESVRVHTSANDSKELILQKPLLLKQKMTSTVPLLSKPSNQIYSHLNSFQSLSSITDPRRLNYRQTKFGGQFTGFSSYQASGAGCSARINVGSRGIVDSDVSLQKQNPSAVLLGALNCPSKNVDTMMTQMSNNSRKNQGMIDVWLEEELDFLWIGVRRHGQGNWEAMLRDPSLSFSKHKTIEDLSERWKKERLKILNHGNLPTHGSASLLSGMFRGSSERRNICLPVADTTLPLFKDQRPSSRGKQVEQNLLLGGLINIPIPKVKKEAEAIEDSSQIHQPEAKEVSSEGTISD